jgi:hypothetical protein
LVTKIGHVILDLCNRNGSLEDDSSKSTQEPRIMYLAEREWSCRCAGVCGREGLEPWDWGGRKM